MNSDSPLANLGAGGCGLVAGFLAGLLGIGGGGVLAPLLSLVVGLPQHVAQGMSLGAMLPPVGYPALRAYQQAGAKVPWRLVGFLVVAFACAAPLGSFLALHIASRPLKWGFSLFLIVNAIRTAQKPISAPATISTPVGGETSATVTVDRAPSTLSPVWGIPIGLLAGTLSGLLGIGGGLVVIPALSRCGYKRLETQAASVAMMIPPIGLPAVLVYARGPEGLPWRLLAAVIFGFVCGNFFGGKTSTQISEKTAKYVSLTLFCGLALFLAVRA
jgi:uncharacterized membrane protein YfcA